MAFISGLVLFDFGWFREQFCIVACPYGRFQSVLMDDQSMVVGYDAARGEPRREGGDCVNCYRCVAVCPTGVDIRRGTQMECIACTACMDACDEVMARTGKPTGLIRYKSVTALKPRSLAYAAVLLLLAAGLTLKLSTRSLISVELVRAIEAPYQVIGAAGAGADGGMRVTNHFKLDVRNQDFEATSVRIELAPDSLAAGVELVTVSPELRLSPGELRRVDVFFQFPTSLLRSGSGRAWLNVGDRKVEVRLVGPFT
jgi:cytochrome c oxidase accessory protein FixG